MLSCFLVILLLVMSLSSSFGFVFLLNWLMLVFSIFFICFWGVRFLIF